MLFLSLGRFILKTLLFAGLFMLFSSSIQAQLVINEFLPDPSTPQDAGEWIELYNHSDIEIQLDNYSLDDAEGGSKPYQLSGVIKAKKFLLIPKSESNIALNNSSDQIRLFDDAEKLIDSIEYNSMPEDNSYARTPDASDNWQISQTPTPDKPNQPESTQNPSHETPTQITINEIMACPEVGDSEWIELKNSDSTPANLNNWYAIDASDNKIAINLTIQAHSLASTSWSQSILNNSGDELYLYNQKNELVDQLSYTNCQSSYSYALFPDQGWMYTSSVTKNSTNILTVPTPTKTKNKTPASTTQQEKEKFTSTPELSPNRAVVLETTHQPNQINLESTSATFSSSPISSIAGIIDANHMSATGTPTQQVTSISDIQKKSISNPLVFIGSGTLLLISGFKKKFFSRLKDFDY